MNPKVLIKHVVGLSGGKDSTALALALREREPREYEYICTPTGNELPELFDHLDYMENLLGQEIKRIGIGIDLYQLIEEQKMIPNFRARFCTRALKIEPTIEYMRNLPKGSILYVGLRADEETRSGIYSNHVQSRYPMREWGWTIGDVCRYLDEKGIQIPRRTDCGVCFYQTIGEWWNLWRDNPKEYQEGVDVEEQMGHTFRSNSRDTWPAALIMLRKEFERGRIPRDANINIDLFGGKTCRVCSL